MKLTGLNLSKKVREKILWLMMSVVPWVNQTYPVSFLRDGSSRSAISIINEREWWTVFCYVLVYKMWICWSTTLSLRIGFFVYVLELSLCIQNNIGVGFIFHDTNIWWCICQIGVRIFTKNYHTKNATYVSPVLPDNALNSHFDF